MVFNQAQQLNQQIIEELSHRYARSALERLDHEKRLSQPQNGPPVKIS